MNDMTSGFQRGTAKKFRIGSSCFHQRHHNSFVHKTIASSFCNHRGRTLHLFFNAHNIL